MARVGVEDESLAFLPDILEELDLRHNRAAQEALERKRRAEEEKLWEDVTDALGTYGNEENGYESQPLRTKPVRVDVNGDKHEVWLKEVLRYPPSIDQYPNRTDSISIVGKTMQGPERELFTVARLGVNNWRGKRAKVEQLTMASRIVSQINYSLFRQYPHRAYFPRR